MRAVVRLLKRTMVLVQHQFLWRREIRSPQLWSDRQPGECAAVVTTVQPQNQGLAIGSDAEGQNRSRQEQS